MTSEVMVIMTSGHHMKVMKNILLGIVFVGFTLYSSMVIVEQGYVGFVTLSLREPWAMQMLLDLSISLFVVGRWMRRDARERGLPVLPYLLLMPALGSVATLGYLVHRALKSRTRARRIDVGGGVVSALSR